jgi:hypothetical protein
MSARADRGDFYGHALCFISLLIGYLYSIRNNTIPMEVPMPLIAFYSPDGLLVLACALLVSCLIYMKNIKTKIVPIANLTTVLVFIVSLIFIIQILAEGLSDPSESAKMAGLSLIMNIYAGICNVAARVWARVAELMGNKRLRIRVEVIER